MVPLPLGIMIAAFVSGRLVNRYSSAWLCGAGLIILAGGAILLSLMQPGVSTFLIVLAAAVCGIGFGIFQVPNNHSMLATAPHSRSGAASAMLSLSRLIGQTRGAIQAVQRIEQRSGPERAGHGRSEKPDQGAGQDNRRDEA